MIVLKGAGERVKVLQFSPDGRTLVAPCSDGVQVWHDLTAFHPTTVPTHEWVSWVRFSPDGTKLLVGTCGIAVHDLPTGVAVEIALRWPHGTLAFCDVSPDGKFLVASQVGWVRCWLLADLESPLWSSDSPAPSLGRPPLFLGGGERFVLIEARPTPAGGQRVYVIRNTKTGAVLAEAPVASRGWSICPVQSPDRRLIADHLQTRVVVFRADDLGEEPVTFRNDNRKEFTGLAFHPSGRFLAATSNDNTLKLYDTTTWAVTKAFNFDIGRLHSVAFSPDGMLAAVGGDRGQIVLWDVDF